MDNIDTFPLVPPRDIDEARMVVDQLLGHEADPDMFSQVLESTVAWDEPGAYERLRIAAADRWKAALQSARVVSVGFGEDQRDVPETSPRMQRLAAIASHARKALKNYVQASS